jgi:hypothetical protein
MQESNEPGNKNGKWYPVHKNKDKALVVEYIRRFLENQKREYEEDNIFMEEKFPRLKARKWDMRTKSKPKAPTETFKWYAEAVGKANTGVEETPISSWVQVAARSNRKEKKKATPFINTKSARE